MAERITTFNALFSRQSLINANTMIIGVEGPYSADTDAQRQANLEIMNMAAARLFEMGHIPLIGVNAALPIVAHLKGAVQYEAIMEIALAIINTCEALLMIGESPGSNRERDLVLSKGLPVFYDIEEVV